MRSVAGRLPGRVRAHAATRRISTDADPAQLADLVLLSFQSGMLLAQVPRDITPLKDVSRAAVDEVQAFARSPEVEVLRVR